MAGRNQGQRGAAPKKPPPRVRKRVDPDAVIFGANTTNFVPDALVPKVKAPPASKALRAGVVSPPSAAQTKGLKAQRLSDARKSPVDTKAAVRLRATETAAEKAARTVAPPPRKKKEDWTAWGLIKPVLGEIARSEFVQALGESAQKTATMAPEVTSALDPIFQYVNEGLGQINDVTSQALSDPVDLAQGKVPHRDALGRETQHAGFDGLFRPDIVKNFSVGVGEAIAGSGAGVFMVATEPDVVFHELKKQYAAYYGPAFAGDWEQFRKNLAEQPVQVVFDVWTALSAGTGLAARAGAVGRTAGASAEELANLSRAQAITKAALFKMEPSKIRLANGEEWNRFGRKPTLRTETHHGAEVQRHAPQGEVGRIVGDVLQGRRAKSKAPLAERNRNRRLAKLTREHLETYKVRSHAELNAFAHSIADYSPRVLDRIGERIGVKGAGRVGATARVIEAGRATTTHALAAAVDSVAMAGGTIEDALGLIGNDLQNLRGRLHEAGGKNRNLQIRIRDYQNAAKVLQDVVDNPDAPHNVQLVADINRTREVANEVQKTLVDYGLLSPSTAGRVLDRQFKDAQVLHSVEVSQRRDLLEQVMRARWEGLPEKELETKVGHALDLLDAEAYSMSRRTGIEPSDFYDDAIRKVVPEYNDAMLSQISDFNRGLDPAVAAKNARQFMKTDETVLNKNDVWRSQQGDGVGYETIGPISTEGWLARIVHVFGGDMEAIVAAAHWYEQFEPLFRRFFPEAGQMATADALMRGFAVSQANASPADGLANVFKVLDAIEAGREIPKKGPGSISTVAASIRMAAVGDHITEGMAAKLHDFADSLEGKTTRTWTGDHPEGGAPSAIDIHAQRDLGYVDPKILTTLRDRHGLPVAHLQLAVLEAKLAEEVLGKGRVIASHKKKYTGDVLNTKIAKVVSDRKKEIADFKRDNKQAIVEGKKSGITMDNPGASATGATYNAPLRRYTEITDHLNEIGFAGKTDWTPAQTQALGWSGIQRFHGVVPEDLQYAIDRNTFAVALEVVGGAENIGADLSFQSALALTKASAALVEKVVSDYTNATLRDIKFGSGGYEATLSPTMQIEIIGSKEVTAEIASRLSRIFKQDEVWVTRPAVQGPTSRTSIDIESPRFKSATGVKKFWDALQANAPDSLREHLAGFSPYHYVDDAGVDQRGIRIITNHPSHAPSERAAMEARYFDTLATVETASKTPLTVHFNNVEVRRFDQHGDVSASKTTRASRESTADPRQAERDALVESARSTRAADEALTEPAMALAQWTPPHWTAGEDAPLPPPRGGALITKDGADLYFGAGADISTFIHEVGHAVLDQNLAWLHDWNPDAAARIGKLLEMDVPTEGRLFSLGDIVTERAQEIFAYAVDHWVGRGRPPATQLRRAWRTAKEDKRDVPPPPEYREAVAKAVQDPDFMQFVADVFDPFFGMKAGDGSFHVPRHPPISLNPFTALRKTTLGKSRFKVRESTGVLHESARDVLGPEAVAKRAAQLQRHVDQEIIHQEILKKFAVEMPKDELGIYLAEAPEGFEIFNPDGLRGFTRPLGEEKARTALHSDETIPDAEVFDFEPMMANEWAHEAASQIANQVFPANRMHLDGEGKLYMVPSAVRDAYTQDLARVFVGGMTGRGLQIAVDTIKSLNSLQRLRMFLSFRYLVLNVGGTGALNLMHQGVFYPANIARAVKLYHANPHLRERIRAEIGGGAYEAFDINVAERPVVSSIDALAHKVGQTVSRPEAAMRETSMLHHLYRAGFRDEESIVKLFDEAKLGGDAEATLNALSRWAEEDVVRFRGLPPAEKEMLRSFFFVSGWLTAATRFTLRYPINHPFWAQAMIQLGDVGWDEMRRRFAPFSAATHTSIAVGAGKKGTKWYIEDVDLGQLLPFQTGADTAAMAANFLTLGLAGGDRDLASAYASGVKLLDTAAHGGDTGYGTIGGPMDFVDQFLISGTPLDHVADAWPQGFRWAGHERTPSKERVPQSLKEYMLEWTFGRMWPTKFYADETRERWAKTQSGTTRAATKTRTWADHYEAVTGSPPPENAYTAMAAKYRWESEWASQRSKLESAGKDQEEITVAEARERTKIMKDMGLWPEGYTFTAATADEFLANVQVVWDENVKAITDTVSDSALGVSK